MSYVNHFSAVVGEKIAYNRILNPDFWQNGKFDQAVRTKLLQIANDFYTDLKVDAPIIDIHLTGSMASYSWTELSDLDVHVHIDFSLIDENTELVKQALEGQKFVWKLRHPVSIKGHDVEMYVQDSKTHTISSGIYSLLKDEWVVEPKYDPPTIDSYEIAEKVEEYKKEIEELHKLLDENAEEDARLIFDRAKVLKKKISGARDAALQKSGEFSPENLIFKELRSQGYIGKLIKLQAKAYSAIYSDDDYVPDETKIMQEEEKPIKETKNNSTRMRRIQSFSGYFANVEPVYENIAAAKSYMKKLKATDLQKEVNQLTPEEEAQALNQRDYKAILQMLSDQPGYVMPFVRFRYDQGIPVERLKELATTLKTKKHIIQQLPANIDAYATMETQDRITGFEKLHDAIRTVERTKEAKWFVDRLPRALRDQYRQLPPEKKTIVVNAAHSLSELGQEITGRLMQKIKAMGNWAMDDVIEYILNFLKGYSNADMQKKVDAIAALEPEAGLLYLDDRYLALSARTAQSQKDLCSVANWCINRGSFTNYANDAVQLNIFDFGKPPTDPLFLTGTTIYYSGNVRTSHDINDTHIKKSDKPEEHLRLLGYPQKMINDIMRQLPIEMMVKKVIYDLKVNELSPANVIFGVIQKSYSVDPEIDDEALSIVRNILVERIHDIATRKDIYEMYVKYGALSKFSADLLNDLFPDRTPEEHQKIVDRTRSLFHLINLAANSPTADFAKKAEIRNLLAQEKAVMAALEANDDKTNAVLEMLEQVLADAPTKAPTKTPTKTPTKPSTPGRPSPIPTKRPFKTPEPAKATEEDVLKRLKSILNGTSV